MVDGQVHEPSTLEDPFFCVTSGEKFGGVNNTSQTTWNIWDMVINGEED